MSFTMRSSLPYAGGRPGGRPPGVCRPVVEQTILPLRDSAMAGLVTRHNRRLTLIASKGETANGCTYSIATSYRYPTNGSIPGLPPGISLFI